MFQFLLNFIENRSQFCSSTDRSRSISFNAADWCSECGTFFLLNEDCEQQSMMNVYILYLHVH